MPDRCPGCGQLPRRHLSHPTGLNPPGTCPNLIRRGQVCGTDLTTTPRQTFPAGDRRLAAQRWLDDHLTACDGDPATVTDLLDLQAAATWIRSRTTARDFEPYGPAAVEAFTRYITHRSDGRRPAQHAFTDPLLVAAVVTHAVALIRADTARRRRAHADQQAGKDPTDADQRQPLADPVPGVTAAATQRHRPHQGLDNARPLHPLPTPIADPHEIAQLRVRRRDRLGGILHEYEHAASPARMRFPAGTTLPVIPPVADSSRQRSLPRITPGGSIYALWHKDSSSRLVICRELQPMPLGLNVVGPGGALAGKGHHR
jgi:hypothetical protein